MDQNLDDIAPPPWGEAALTAFLGRLGVAFDLHRHPPLHTVEESRGLRGQLPGLHVKNLFLKDRDGGFLLVTLLEDRAVKVNALVRDLGARRASFAPAEDLWQVLGVLPGAVTPLAVLNDRAGRVRLALDAGLEGAEKINVHPLHNEATVAMSWPDLVRVCAAAGHAPGTFDPAASAG